MDSTHRLQLTWLGKAAKRLHGLIPRDTGQESDKAPQVIRMCSPASEPRIDFQNIHLTGTRTTLPYHVWFPVPDSREEVLNKYRLNGKTARRVKPHGLSSGRANGSSQLPQTNSRWWCCISRGSPTNWGQRELTVLQSYLTVPSSTCSRDPEMASFPHSHLLAWPTRSKEMGSLPGTGAPWLCTGSSASIHKELPWTQSHAGP